KKTQEWNDSGIDPDRRYARIVIREIEALRPLVVVTIRAEQSGASTRGRQCQYQRLAFSLARSFVTSEEECFVLQNRPTERTTELVTLEFRLHRVCATPGFRCPVERIKVVVSEELEQRTVELVGTRFRDRADNCARLALIFRRVIVRDDLEFFD